MSNKRNNNKFDKSNKEVVINVEEFESNENLDAPNTEDAAEAATQDVSTDPVETKEPEPTPAPTPVLEPEKDQEQTGPVLHRGIVFRCEKLNVREGAGKEYSIICTIARGEEYIVKETENSDWLKIPGKGFVMKEFINIIR